MHKAFQFHPDAEIKALIFDCDGTLADTFPAHYRAFKEALEIYNINFETDFYAARVGLSRYQLLTQLATETGIAFDPEDIAARNADLFLKHIDAVTPIPFVTDIVRQFQGVMPLGVASGGQAAIVTATLQAIKLYDIFDTVVTIEDTHRGKPHPDLYLTAAERLKINPEDIQAFEDSDEGIEAARSATMKVIDIRPYYQPDPTTW
ncbi:HAD family phosphatase [Asticcacaulis sp. ZE23SCel15]|uniref:HAD family hydrolase n=1 Tax=Asticcacaulis sp. ZE23SCel15 TaxID=3059027 RepID=UPI00265E9412|nr:HAD family phosphatase [Asticcacaulis sp. ZE23SCel15]WKL56531.1 HAD family phosphatase [Asticcacaulis sp. ZE23SCel15]